MAIEYTIRYVRSTEEYRVDFTEEGKLISQYFTNDLKDAKDTIALEIGRQNK